MYYNDIIGFIILFLSHIGRRLLQIQFTMDIIYFVEMKTIIRLFQHLERLYINKGNNLFNTNFYIINTIKIINI